MKPQPGTAEHERETDELEKARREATETVSRDQQSDDKARESMHEDAMTREQQSDDKAREELRKND